MFGGGGGGGFDPRQMQQMMDQLGVEMDDLEASSVVIALEDGRELVFDAPDVMRMDAQGQTTFQVVGDPTERDAGGDAAPAVEGGADDGAAGGAGGVPEEDVELVVERTGADSEAAREALDATGGDLAAAIARLE